MGIVTVRLVQSVQYGHRQICRTVPDSREEAQCAHRIPRKTVLHIAVPCMPLTRQEALAQGKGWVQRRD